MKNQEQYDKDNHISKMLHKQTNSQSSADGIVKPPHEYNSKKHFSSEIEKKIL